MYFKELTFSIFVMELSLIFFWGGGRGLMAVNNECIEIRSLQLSGVGALRGAAG